MVFVMATTLTVTPFITGGGAKPSSSRPQMQGLVAMYPGLPHGGDVIGAAGARVSETSSAGIPCAMHVAVRAGPTKP